MTGRHVKQSRVARWGRLSGARRGTIAVVVTVSLVAGTVTAAAVGSAIMGEKRLPDPVSLLGAIDSTVAPPVVGSLPSEGEFTLPVEAEVPAKLQAPSPTLDLEALEADPVSRDAFTDTFDAGGGLMATVTSPVQSNMLVGEGERAEWVPISTTIRPFEKGGFTAAPHPLSPVFAPSLESDVLSLTVDGYVISWRLLGAADSRAELGADGTSVVYREIAPGIDLRYSLDGPGVKEEFVLAERPADAAATPVFRFAVTSPGLEFVSADDGSLRFVDGEGVERALVPPSVMWDSSGVDGKREPELARVALKVEPSPEGDDAPGLAWVTVAPDAEWLMHSERVYPVTVDPTSTGFGASNVFSKKSDGSNYYGSLLVGNPAQNPTRYWRGFSQWNLASIAGTVVYDTTMVIAYAGDGTTNCYAGWVGTASVWPPSSFSHYGSDAADYGLCGSDAFASYSIFDALGSAVGVGDS